ncbi:heavy metal-associated isoprenylated plant protein 16-like [Apium graveolens]|uniref:heavy metal-associated isoprenylated plant protein 16-like n=1 Tax=Apium graveolens TaxID=4045 RepID=UPI003D7B1FFF
MEQQIDMMVTIHGEKDRAKALTIAAGITGVTSVTIRGRDKNILTVIGNQVDIVGLTRSLMKKLDNATVVSVIPLNGSRFGREQAAASMRYESQPNHYGNYNFRQPDYYGQNYEYSQPEYCYYNPAAPRYPSRPPPSDQYYYLCEEPADSSCSIM